MKSSIKLIFFLFVFLASITYIVSCNQELEGSKTYTISYDTNGADGGTVPEDQTKTHDENVTLATNSGDLVRTGYEFGGWNTQADGNGTNYAVGATFTVNGDTTLYVKWDANKYTITYDANSATGGDIPDSQIKTHNVELALATNEGNLNRTNYILGGWNTQADGSGTDYGLGATFTTNANTTLYAKWRLIEVGGIGPAGGYIFFENDNYLIEGWRYLEAAPEGWSGEEEDPKHVFGFYRTDTSGGEYTSAVGTQTGIGTGKHNTEELVATIGEKAHYSNTGDVQGIYAAKVALDYSVEVDGIVYDDWFLPSKDESDKMYKNLHLLNLGGFSLYYYWSSSENDALSTWCVYIDNGSLSINPRNFDTGRVRPVRRF